jgi:hypothetical protein
MDCVAKLEFSSTVISTEILFDLLVHSPVQGSCCIAASVLMLGTTPVQGKW